jgi:hypothetical protein
MPVSGQKKKSKNYSLMTLQVLNVVFYDLFPAVLGVKAALTLLSLYPSILD